MRYKLALAYEGTDFHGWQKQHPPGEMPLRTVQGVLEAAVAEVVREPVNVLGASRTDAGVHARSQVAAFTTNANLAPRSLLRALNSRLPDDVQVRRARFARDDFDPIQNAVAKGYRYSVAWGDPRFVLPPLFTRRVRTCAPWRLDPDRMNRAAADLVGTHDFACFAKAGHGRESTVRTIYACRVVTERPHRLFIDVSGDGFLYNMVRIIAGTLLDVGRGRLEPDAVPAILASGDRAAAGPTLPPQALCLMWIRYRQPNAVTASPVP